MIGTYAKRHEQKYLLRLPLHPEIARFFAEATVEDEYGTSDIYTRYFDTPDFRSKRARYGGKGLREKFRIRSYGHPEAAGVVFLELKKKLKHITYKRRMPVSCEDIPACLDAVRGRASNEIEWFLRSHHESHCFTIVYRRAPRRGKTLPDFRATFDTDIRCAAPGGSFIPLIEAGQCLLEIKSPFAMPFELCGIFSRLRLYPVSFSKSKAAYQKLYPKIRAACAFYGAAPNE
jgi:hypothetical protein